MSALHGTGPLASQVPEQLGSDGEGAQQVWASSTRSRVVLLERLRAHTSRHEGSVVATSFFFELPVDTERYGDYEARVSSPPICLRDIGDKLYAGRYRTPESWIVTCGASSRTAATTILKDLWCASSATPYPGSWSSGSPTTTRARSWWARRCVRTRGRTRRSSRPAARGAAARGCPDCMRGLPDLCVARPCAETGASLHVCAFLPTAGLAVCVRGGAARFRFRRAGLGRGAGRGALQRPAAAAAPGAGAAGGGARASPTRPPPPTARTATAGPSARSPPTSRLCPPAYTSNFLPPCCCCCCCWGAPSTLACLVLDSASSSILL